jgi:hypothetical protein
MILTRAEIAHQTLNGDALKAAAGVFRPQARIIGMILTDAAML